MKNPGVEELVEAYASSNSTYLASQWRSADLNFAASSDTATKYRIITMGIALIFNAPSYYFGGWGIGLATSAILVALFGALVVLLHMHSVALNAAMSTQVNAAYASALLWHINNRLAAASDAVGRDDSH